MPKNTRAGDAGVGCVTDHAVAVWVVLKAWIGEKNLAHGRFPHGRRPLITICMTAQLFGVISYDLAMLRTFLISNSSGFQIP